MRRFRKDFPLLDKFVYFDNACMSLKPVSVVEAVRSYYDRFSSCGGRSVHSLSRGVDELVLKTRKLAVKFFGARSVEEVVFTSGSTYGVNLVARSFPFKRGDLVLTSDKEHNSNLLPWRSLKGVKHSFFEFGNLDDFTDKVRKASFVSLVHTSNFDGSSQDVSEFVKVAHEFDVPVLVDAAQSAPHMPLNVRRLDVDFLVASGHKMLGPTATGVLYGKKSALESLRPGLLGGGTVKDFVNGRVVLEDLPFRFEAGLQNYAGIVGLGEAFRYLRRVGLSRVHKYESRLGSFLRGLLLSEGFDVSGFGGVASLSLENPGRVSYLLSKKFGVATRSGRHCVFHWCNKKGIKSSLRASLYFYNTGEEVSFFVDALKKVLNSRRLLSVKTVDCGRD